MTLQLKNLLKSPFGIAAVAGVLDLTGGFIATISDIYWLVFDVVIKTDEITRHTLAYGSILGGLIFAAISLAGGLIFTILCYKKYKESGLESHDRKLVINHLKEVKCSNNFKKINK